MGWFRKMLGIERAPDSGFVAELAEQLSSTDVRLKRRAAKRLARIREGHVVARAALETALGDDNAWVRMWSAEALGWIGARTQEVNLRRLIEALHDPESRVRGAAVEAIRRIGPEARLAVPALIETLRDEHDIVRDLAGQALVRLDSRFGATLKELEAAIYARELGAVERAVENVEALAAAISQGEKSEHRPEGT